MPTLTCSWQVKGYAQQIAQYRREAAQLRLEADRLSGPETFAKAAKLQRQALQLDKTVQRVRRTQVRAGSRSSHCMQ